MTTWWFALTRPYHCACFSRELKGIRNLFIGNLPINSTMGTVVAVAALLGFLVVLASGVTYGSWGHLAWMTGVVIVFSLPRLISWVRWERMLPEFDESPADPGHDHRYAAELPPSAPPHEAVEDLTRLLFCEDCGEQIRERTELVVAYKWPLSVCPLHDRCYARDRKDLYGAAYTGKTPLNSIGFTAAGVGGLVLSSVVLPSLLLRGGSNVTISDLLWFCLPLVLGSAALIGVRLHCWIKYERRLKR